MSWTCSHVLFCASSPFPMWSFCCDILSRLDLPPPTGLGPRTPDIVNPHDEPVWTNKESLMLLKSPRLPAIMVATTTWHTGSLKKNPIFPQHRFYMSFPSALWSSLVTHNRPLGSIANICSHCAEHKFLRRLPT